MNMPKTVSEHLNMVNCILDMIAGYKKMSIILYQRFNGNITDEQAFEEITIVCEEVAERLKFYEKLNKESTTNGTEK